MHSPFLSHRTISFTFPSQTYNGTNVYAVLSSPRASGAEAILISASRVSLNENLNLRGIATVLSLAGYLKGIVQGLPQIAHH